MSDSPIVVGIDGSPVADAALLWAARIADAWHKPLLIVVGGDVARSEEIGIGSPNPSGDLLAGAEAAVRRAGFAGEVVKVLRDEQPEPLLDDLSEHATLLVVGAGWEGRLASLVFGSVSAHLQAHGRCPVVTVPPEWISRPASERPLVVVGVEPSAGGLEAMEFAMTYAEATGSKVLAIRCWERADAVDSRDPLAERDLQRLLLDGIVADAAARHPFVQVAKQVTPGPVHDALRLAALSADLIVIGTRYPTGVKGSRLGPIAARLTRRMPCPVAVVSPPGAEPPLEVTDPEPSYANGA